MKHLCSILCQLRDGSSHLGTVTSMEPNEGTFVLHTETMKVLMRIVFHIGHKTECGNPKNHFMMLDCYKFDLSKSSSRMWSFCLNPNSRFLHCYSHQCYSDINL